MKQKPETEQQAYERLRAKLGVKGAELLDKILTDAEKHNITQRWRVYEMLSAGVPHRSISAALGVSLCKTIMVARILKGKVAKGTKTKSVKKNGTNLASKSKDKVCSKTAKLRRARAKR